MLQAAAKTGWLMCSFFRRKFTMCSAVYSGGCSYCRWSKFFIVSVISTMPSRSSIDWRTVSVIVGHFSSFSLVFFPLFLLIVPPRQSVLHYGYINRFAVHGVIQAGDLDKFVHLFRRYVLPVVFGKKVHENHEITAAVIQYAAIGTPLAFVLRSDTFLVQLVPQRNAVTMHDFTDSIIEILVIDISLLQKASKHLVHAYDHNAL